MVLAEQIKEAAARRDTLYRCLDIEQRRIDLRNEEEKTQEPDFWNDPAKAREQLRKVAGRPSLPAGCIVAASMRQTRGAACSST